MEQKPAFSPKLKQGEMDIIVQVEQEIQQSIRWSQSEVHGQIAEGMEYYFGQKPYPSREGYSQYVSRDVFEGIEGMVVPITEMYTVNPRVVEFSSKEDPELMVWATDYVNQIILKKNNGEQIFETWFRDALLSKNGIVKSWWDEDYARIPYEFEKLDDDEFDMLMSDEDVDDETVEFTRKEYVTEGTTFVEISGTVDKIKDISQVRIENIPPEEFLISQLTRDIEKPQFAAHRTEKTLAELGEMFELSKEELENAANYQDEATWHSVKHARHSTDSTWINYFDDTGNGDLQQRKIWLYEVYIQSTHGSKDGKSRMLQVFTDRFNVFEVNEVESSPFSYVCPYPIDHKFYGQSVADVLREIQSTKTTLVRGVLDHTVITTNPRMVAMKGAYDPRSLLNNAPGAVLEVMDPDAVTPLQQPQLTNGVFDTINLMESAKESRTGQSKASQGLDENMMKNNKSGAFVDSVLSQGELRLRGIARRFSYGVKHLMKRIYHLERENCSKMVEYTDRGGEKVEGTPNDWPKIVDTCTAVAIGRNAQVEKANFLTGMSQQLKEQGVLTPDKEVALAREVLQLNNIMNVDDYVGSAEEVEAYRDQEMRKAMEMQKEIDSQPTPMEQFQMEMAQKEQENKQMELEVRQQEVQVRQMEAQIRQAESEVKAESARNDHEANMMELEIKAQKSNAEIQVMLQESEMNEAEAFSKIEKNAADIQVNARKSAQEDAKRTTDAQDAVAAPLPEVAF